MEYIAAGNIMVDMVHFPDGSKNRDQLGGPAGFAYAGIRLFSDDSLLVCNVGEDFHSYFGPWAEKNAVDLRGVKVQAEYCNHSNLIYRADGTYAYASKDVDEETFGQYMETIGYLKTRPEEIGDHSPGVKGVYMAQNHDRIFWDKLGAIKKRDGFKMIWEIEGPSARKRFLDPVVYALQYADVFSINLQESRALSGLEGEEENIDFLKSLPVDMVLFRVGAKGLYTLHGGKSYFHPSVLDFGVVDPTGCGNTSTGAAIYGYCNHPDDPIMVGTIANVAAAQNAKQFGLIPEYASAREESLAKVREIYDTYKG